MKYNTIHVHNGATYKRTPELEPLLHWDPSPGRVHYVGVPQSFRGIFMGGVFTLCYKFAGYINLLKIRIPLCIETTVVYKNKATCIEWATIFPVVTYIECYMIVILTSACSTTTSKCGHFLLIPIRCLDRDLFMTESEATSY